MLKRERCLRHARIREEQGISEDVFRIISYLFMTALILLTIFLNSDNVENEHMICICMFLPQNFMLIT
jgi:hypothetical protein